METACKGPIIQVTALRKEYPVLYLRHLGFRQKHPAQPAGRHGKAYPGPGIHRRRAHWPAF